MVFVLAVGDLHIPTRAADIPEQFKKLFTPGKISHILLTGNVVTREIYDYFTAVCHNVHAARGEYDDYMKDVPEQQIVQIEDLKFGVIHGHQVVPWGDKEALAMWRRKLDVDVLVYGHTHQQKLTEVDGRLLVNPGSITGAHSAFESDVTPTFVLMDVQGSTIVSFIYSLDGQELRVKRKEWTRA